MVVTSSLQLPPRCTLWRRGRLLGRLHPALQGDLHSAPAASTAADPRGKCSEESDAASASSRQALDHQNWWAISRRRRLLVHISRRRRTNQQSVGTLRSVLPAIARVVGFVGKSLCGTVACSFMAYHMVRSVVALSSMFLAYSLDSASFFKLNLPNGGCQTYPLFGHAMRQIHVAAIWARDTFQHATCQTSCGK